MPLPNLVVLRFEMSELQNGYNELEEGLSHETVIF
jgi:hypothetical protein